MILLLMGKRYWNIQVHANNVSKAIKIVKKICSQKEIFIYKF